MPLSSTPRPHRWSAICAEWARQGHEVEVITSQYAGQNQEQCIDGVHVERVGYAGPKAYILGFKKCTFGKFLSQGHARFATFPFWISCLQPIFTSLSFS